MGLAIAIHFSVIMAYTTDARVRTAPYEWQNIELELIGKEPVIQTHTVPLLTKEKIKPALDVKVPLKKSITPKIMKPRLAVPMSGTQFQPSSNKVPRIVHTSKNMLPVIEPKNSSANVSKLRKDYLSDLATWLERHKRYPVLAHRRGQQGEIVVKFAISPDGTLLDQEFISPSRHASLNQAVRKMLRSASPMPPVPVSLRNGKSKFEYTMPVIFELK